MTTAFTTRPRTIVIRSTLVALASATTLLFASSALAQDNGHITTAAEAKVMLEKVTVAVRINKAKALEIFNKGEGEFPDRDMSPFCANATDGKIVAINSDKAWQWLGEDIRSLKDARGMAHGAAQFAAADKPEDEFTEVNFHSSNSGAHTSPVAKVSLTTRVGDLVCGVSYHPVYYPIYGISAHISRNGSKRSEHVHRLPKPMKASWPSLCSMSCARRDVPSRPR
jgi:hypothetical protein